MEKLELKHLAPYLPYGLKIRNVLGKGSTWTLTRFNIEQFSDDDKPILRHLSDLTKEEEKEIHSKCPNLPNYQEFHKEWINEKGLDLSETIIEYAAMEILFEWHFDVFGLIDKGLAIDINTI